MATTKSSVLGLRIDHDRRAWVEAEAARQGLTIRTLFEGFIESSVREGLDIRGPLV